MVDDIAGIARKLGAAQKRVVLALSDEWGRSHNHQAAKRLWHRNDIPMLLDHQHCTDDSWRLRPKGVAVRNHLKGSDNGK